jgi:hypothetical protein
VGGQLGGRALQGGENDVGFGLARRGEGREVEEEVADPSLENSMRRPLSLSLSPSASSFSSFSYLQPDHRAALLDGLHGVLDLRRVRERRGEIR